MTPRSRSKGGKLNKFLKHEPHVSLLLPMSQQSVFGRIVALGSVATHHLFPRYSDTAESQLRGITFTQEACPPTNNSANIP